MLPGMSSMAGLRGNPDPFFDNVTLLLQFNEAVSSIVPVDGSKYALNATRSGSAGSIQNSTPKFGNYWDTSTGSLTRHDALSQLGNGDFTIESWVRFPVVANGTGQPCIWDTRDADGQGTPYIRNTFNDGKWYFRDSDTNRYEWSPAADTWYHVAQCRSGITLRHFVDGVLVGSGTNTGNFTTGRLYIASDYQSDRGRILIDDFRLTIGVARYTAAFSPPVSPFPDF